MSTGLMKHEKLDIDAVLAVSLSTVIAVLDSTIANADLPNIANVFGVNESSSIMIINSYQFAVVFSLLVFAALGKTIGNKKISFMDQYYLHCLLSGGAFSDTLDIMTFFRLLQGFGAAAILSVNAALIKDIYPDRLLSHGLTINVMLVSVSAAAGLPIASAILSMANWNWLLTINIPVSCISLLLCRVSLKSTPSTKARFDKAGAGLVFLTVTFFSALVLALTNNDFNEIVMATITLTFLTIPLYLSQKDKSSGALIPVKIFSNKTFSLSLLMSLLLYCSQMLAYVSLPFYFQNVLHCNFVKTGMVLTAWPLGMKLNSMLAGYLNHQHNPKQVALTGLLLLVVGTLFITWLPAGISSLRGLWRIAICGLGIGLFQSTNNLLIMTSVTQENTSIASGLLGSSRLVGQITGSALVAMFFNRCRDRGISISMLVAALFSIFFINFGLSSLQIWPSGKASLLVVNSKIAIAF